MLTKYTLQLFVLFPFSGFLLLIVEKKKRKEKENWCVRVCVSVCVCVCVGGGWQMKTDRNCYKPIGSIREFSSTATETRLSRPSPRIVAAFVKEMCNVLGTTMHGLCVSICRLTNSCVPMDS